MLRVLIVWFWAILPVLRINRFINMFVCAHLCFLSIYRMLFFLSNNFMFYIFAFWSVHGIHRRHSIDLIVMSSQSHKKLTMLNMIPSTCRRITKFTNYKINLITFHWRKMKFIYFITKLKSPEEVNCLNFSVNETQLKRQFFTTYSSSYFDFHFIK